MFPFLLIIFIFAFGGCNKRDDNAYDERFIPYGIKSFDVWVYNTKTDKDYYVGSVATSYANAQQKLSSAADWAYDFAEEYHFKDEEWTYVCYTVTDSSNCVTKVR